MGLIGRIITLVVVGGAALAARPRRADGRKDEADHQRGGRRRGRHLGVAGIRGPGPVAEHPHPVTRVTHTRVLARLAGTGIYLLHGIPRDLQRAVRTRAVNEGTTLRFVLLQGLREYAVGSWTPQLHDDSVSARAQDLNARARELLK